MKKYIRYIAIVVLIAVMGFSGYKLFGIYQTYRQEQKLHEDVLQFRPEPTQPGVSVPAWNQGILDAQKRNADVVGWVTVDGTQIDYPFVQSKDNSFYLRKNLDQEYALAGTIFLDYRNSKDFADANSIIYGHHMKNGSMFGDLREFADASFFQAHQSGRLSLADRSYALELFAYLVVEATDEEIYRTAPMTQAEQEAYLAYIRKNARQFREIDIKQQDRIVTLSSCSYEFTDARMVLLARLLSG